MSFQALNPALVRLLGCQVLARLRRMQRAFSSGRRLALTLLAMILAVIWLGNAVVSVLLRDPYEPGPFRRWISLGLLLYGLWHVVRVACQRPEAAIAWTAAEREWLCGGPFSRRDLLKYRLLVIFSATLPKALLASLLLLPDYPTWWCGVLGTLLGLVFLEYARLVIETVANGVSERVYQIARGTILGVLLFVAGSGLWTALQHAPSAGDPPGWLGLATRWAATLDTYRDLWFGRMAEAPFAVFARIVTAPGLGSELATWLSVAVLLVITLGHAAVRLDGFFHSKSTSEERRRLGAAGGLVATPRRQDAAGIRLPCVPHWGGIGPLAWRQLLGVRQHLGSVLIALVAPGFLACLPLAAPADPKTTFLNVTAGAFFYSFVLLPAALKFDFRRDFERLPMLHRLPIRPAAVVAGEIVLPVLLVTAFQLAVVLMAAAVRPVPASYACVAIALMLPVNVFFVALDNLIFLLYPHRLNQEGFEVFLRTTLTFTAKSVLFGVVAALVLAWMHGSQQLAELLGIAGGTRAVFVAGLGGLAVAIAAITVMLLVRTFRRYDPSLDPVT